MRRERVVWSDPMENVKKLEEDVEFVGTVVDVVDDGKKIMTVFNINCGGESLKVAQSYFYKDKKEKTQRLVWWEQRYKLPWAKGGEAIGTQWYVRRNPKNPDFLEVKKPLLQPLKGKVSTEEILDYYLNRIVTLLEKSNLHLERVERALERSAY